MPLKETEEEKSYRINGFSQTPESANRYKNYNELKQDLSALRIDTKRIEPVLINSLSEYVAEIKKLETSPRRPLYYRMQSKINYYNVPSSLRDENFLNNESWYIKECKKRYPQGFKDCKNTLSALQFIQHYNGNTRLLDITESPFATLIFALNSFYAKYPKDGDSDNYFGTVTLFRAPKENADDYMKFYDSSTASVIASTAMQDREFCYGHIDMDYHGDGFATKINNFVYFRDIIRRSVIVSVPHDNPRIYNQRGNFILVNANELVSIEGNSGREVDFMNYFLHDEDSKSGPLPLNLVRLNKSKFKNLFNVDEWSFMFKKVEPYSSNNKYDEFKTDPFDLNKLYYKKNEKQLVFFISPYAKKTIKKELDSIGYTYDWAYPEPDTIFHNLGNMVRNSEID